MNFKKGRKYENGRRERKKKKELLQRKLTERTV